MAEQHHPEDTSVMLSRGLVIGMVVLGVFPRYWVPNEYTKLLGLHLDWVEESSFLGLCFPGPWSYFIKVKAQNFGGLWPAH